MFIKPLTGSQEFVSSNLNFIRFWICRRGLSGTAWRRIGIGFSLVSMSEKKAPEKADPPRCKYCGTTEAPIFVRAHMECPKCHTVTESCCDGGRCGWLYETSASNNNRSRAVGREWKFKEINFSSYIEICLTNCRSSNTAIKFWSTSWFTCGIG